MKKATVAANKAAGAKGQASVAIAKVPTRNTRTKVEVPTQEEEDEIIEYLKNPPMKGRATTRARRTNEPTYNVAVCNYNDWREWGKYIANGLARTEKNDEGGINFGYVDGPIIARHVQNRNLDYMPETSQKYGGFVTATEENIPQVLQNIADFFADPTNEGIKPFFKVLPEFPLTYPVEGAANLKSTGVATRSNKRAVSKNIMDLIEMAQ